MRRTAGVVALGVALVEIVVFVAAEARVQRAMAEFGAAFGSIWTRLPTAAAFWLPWIVGGVLLLAGRRYLGTVVVVPAAVLGLPSALFSLQWLVDPESRDAGSSFADLVWVQLGGSIVLVILTVAAGILAWLARPRGDWRHGAPQRRNLYTVTAFLAWLPSVLATTQFVDLGAEGTDLGARRFVEFLWNVSGGFAAAIGIASAVLLGLALLIAPALRRDAAGMMVLLIVAPLAVSQVTTVIAVADEEFIISTPAGWLGAGGTLAVTAVAVGWLISGLRSPERRGSTVHLDADDGNTEDRQ